VAADATGTGAESSVMLDPGTLTLRTMTGGPLRRLQELAAGLCTKTRARSRATKEANPAGCQSECNRMGMSGLRQRLRRHR
jgi:hypothetical protein